MERMTLSRLILFLLLMTLLQLEIRSQDVIECHDNSYRFLWQGELVEDESISYACGSNLPEVIEIVFSNGQTITYTVTWTGLANPSGPNIGNSQANVELADFGSNPYTQADLPPFFRTV
jgi:hypothetical protein